MISATALGITVVSSSYGEELVLCPFHSDKTPSAWFSPKKGLFWCSVCHLGLNVNQLARKLEVDVDIEYDEHLDLPDFDLISEKDDRWFGERCYHEYTKSRGISGVTNSIFGIEFSKKENAIVLPVNDRAGVRVGSVLRYISGVQRYRILGKSFPLWPWSMFCMSTTDRRMLITEGAWSSMKFFQETGIRSFALMGARSPSELGDLLSGFNAIVLYDKDKAGLLGMKKTKERFPLLKVMAISPSPDDMSKEDILELRKDLFPDE